jgi:hypothetical protein
LIKKLEKIYTEGNNALVKWFYDTEDDDMKEAGEDFKMLAKLPIEIISTNMDE